MDCYNQGMSELEKQATELVEAVDGAVKKLKITEVEKQLENLKKAAEKSDFWSDQKAAQDNQRLQAKLVSRVAPWKQLLQEVEDIEELAKTGDKSLESDLTKQINNPQRDFDELK